MRQLPLILVGLPTLVLADSLNCPCAVVEVIDGDTVFVQDQFRSSRKIWLAGIDAPELGQAYGQRSRAHLKNLVLGEPVKVEYLNRDRYGHIIGKLLKNDQDINLLQISQGYAWHFTQHENELSRTDSAIYKSAESTARSNRLGLWSTPAIPPWEYRENPSSGRQ